MGETIELHNDDINDYVGPYYVSEKEGVNPDYEILKSVKGCDLGMVTFWVKQGANIKKNGERLLLYSICRSESITQYLIDIGVDIHTNDDEALKLSVYNGNLSFVILLITNGANIHAENDYSLRVSIAYPYYDIVFYLAEFYSVEKFKMFIDKSFLEEMLEDLLKKDLSKHPILVQVYREFGIDLFDLLEKEK